jgi:hypothetical protein
VSPTVISSPSPSTVSVSVNVHNNGSVYDGTETVQLYIRDDVSSVTTPVLELRDWSRALVARGTVVQVLLELEFPKDFALFNQQQTWAVENGNFTIWVHHSTRAHWHCTDTTRRGHSTDSALSLSLRSVRVPPICD